MRYRVTGNMYFEGTVDIVNEEKTIKEFSKTIFDTDAKGLAEHLVICYVVREMDFVEGVGDQGREFLVDNECTEFEDCEVEVVL